jgi:hypothetical protein
MSRILRPEPIFASLAQMLVATVAAGALCSLRSKVDGSVIFSGRADANGVPPNPLQRAIRIDTAELEADATSGYEVQSGSLTGVLAAAGTGYTVSDTLTVVGGFFPYGWASTWNVDSVDAGVITGISAVLPGAYEVMPADGSTLATTGGTGTGATITVTRVPTGVTVDGSSHLLCSAARDTMPVVRVALPCFGPGGWWFPQVIGSEVDYTTETQTTFHATSPHLATGYGFKIQRLNGTNDKWVGGGLAQKTAADWNAYGQRDDNAGTGAGGADSQSGGVIDFATSLGPYDHAMITQWRITNALYLLNNVIDRANTGVHVTAGAGVQASNTNWTFSAADTDTVDKALVFFRLYSGPTAGDALAVTLNSLYGCDAVLVLT